MDHQTLIHPEEADELLKLLANSDRRAVLTYMQESPDEVFSVDGIAENLSNQRERSANSLASLLHHSTLPQFSDIGAVNYDRKTQTVHYRGHSELEGLLGSIESEIR